MMSCLVCNRSWAHNHLRMGDLIHSRLPSVCAQRLNHIEKRRSFYFRCLLTSAEYSNIVSLKSRLMSILETIQKELTRRKWTRYRLAKAVEGRIPLRTIYGYLSEECDLGSRAASIILEELGLHITRRPRKKRREV